MDNGANRRTTGVFTERVPTLSIGLYLLLKRLVRPDFLVGCKFLDFLGPFGAPLFTILFELVGFVDDDIRGAPAAELEFLRTGEVSILFLEVISL